MTKILAHDPDRCCRKVSDWPVLDQQRWYAALEPGDAIDPGGQRVGYAPVSNRRVAASYGRWLQWLDRQSLLDPIVLPGERITPERVRAYVDDLSRINSSQTILVRLEDLYQAALVMASEGDWSWIRRIAACVRAHHVPARPKRPRIIHAEELYALGQSLMAEATKSGTTRQQAINYRDGLLVAFLAARPLRRRNLAGIRIGETLVQRDGVWWIDIPGQGTKAGTPITMPLPDDLSAAIDAYLAVHRPILEALRSRWWCTPGNAFWLSSHGSPMTEPALYDRIVKVTRAALGRPINPHLFRDCAATSIAVDDPDHVRIVAPLLGHRTLSASERHYNQARTREAALRWQEHLLKLRDAPDEFR